MLQAQHRERHSMDSVKSILHSIVLATQHVRNATARYCATRGVRQVRQHSLIRLELEFQTIADASRAILEVFDNPSLRRHYVLDDRLVDWLSSPEPETCLDTLKEMERLLDIDHEAQAFSGFNPTRSGCQEDDINMAITLFYTHKAHFHFLLTTDIWNYEKDVLRQTVHSTTKEVGVQGQEELQTTSTKHIAIEHQKEEIVSQKLNKLLQVLDALKCSEKHRETSSIRQSDTCMWLPATDAYRSWREGKDSFLLLQGKAGAGKSVLASSVINDLNNTKGNGELLAFFYCDFRTKRSTSAVEVMRSLLAQLTAHFCVVMMDPEDLLDELLKGADSRVDSFYNVKGLSHYLSKVARLCPRKPLVVVDALDECREVESLLDGLIMINGDVRMFVTSRPLQNIVQMLSHLPCISMDKMVHELSADILLHITRELDSRRRLRTFNGRLKEEIRSKLFTNADGMFRWVQCQIDTLEKCTSVSEIRRVLDSLPEGLEETYRRILIAIDRRLSDSRQVRRALMWLVTALRPMRLCELLEGLTIDPIRRALDPGFTLIKGADFLEVSRSLVIHHKETDIVTLSHMSVKEYLVGELIQVKLPRYHIVLEDAHERVARLCMAYIAFCLERMKECRGRSSNVTRERNLVPTSYASRPLLNYVLSDGFTHLAHLGSGNAGIFTDMETLQVVIRRHAWEWDQMCKLVPSIRSGTPWPSSEHDFTMYTLVAFASDALFHTFLDRSTPTPREGTNPLVYAAHFDKTDHAKALIMRGVNVNHKGLVVDKLAADDSDMDDLYVDGSDAGDSDSDTSIADYSDERKAMPIQIAVDHWHAEMLDLLLAKGSTIPDGLLTRVFRVQPHQYPLYIIRRLLQTAEFVKWAITPWDNRPLLEAFVEDEEDYEQMKGGDEAMFATRRLVQVGCAETFLLVAVENGCLPVVRTLLLMITSFPSDIPSVSCPYAIVNALAANGDTLLHVAMRLSDENQCLIITELLVEAGCSPCDLDADDKPPIHVAVARGFVSVVEYLLSRDVPLPSRILFAALQATLVKRVELVRFLVRKGANVHVLNPDGDALLHITMRSLDRSVCLEIAEILIDVGCNPLARNLRGETPLHIAAKQGYYEVGNYLILFSSSSDILSLLSDNPESTLRSLIGNTDGLRFWPEEEASVFQEVRQFIDDQDKCLELARIFTCVAGDLFARSSGNAMLFEIAARQGFRKVMEYLTSQPVPLPPATLFTALRYQVSMIPSLICNGVDVHVREDSGDTLLHATMSILTETQCCVTTRVLVEAGCDPFALNIANKQPIHIAVSRGLLSVVEYLLSHAFKVEASLPPDLLFTALQCHKKPLMVHLLMDHRAKMSYLAPNGDHLLHAVLRSTDEHKCLQTTRLLFEAGRGTFAPGADGQTPLHIAVISGFTSIVDYLLTQDVPLPSDILFVALQPSQIYVTYRRTSIISSLVRKGVDVHAQDSNQNTLLHHAMRMQSEDQCMQVTKIFIDAGCSASVCNADGKLPIQVAAARALPPVVEYLLSHNSPFPPDILFAVLGMIRVESEGRCMEVTKLFIDAGCSASIRNADGKLPIQVAVTRALPSVVEHLLSRNAPFPSDILLTVVEGRNAWSREVLRMVSSFVEHGADVCAISANGDTVLHVAFACRTQWIKDSPCRFLDVVDVLVKAGCNTHARDAMGRTPFELAETTGRSEVADYLLFASPCPPIPCSISPPPSSTSPSRGPPSSAPFPQSPLPSLGSVRRAISRLFSPFSA